MQTHTSHLKTIHLKPEFALRVSSYLSCCEIELLRSLLSLSSVQVFVFVEDLFQFGDLLGGELCAHTALRPVLLHLASLVHRETLRGGRLALIPGGIATYF